MIRAGNIVAWAQVWVVLCGFAGQLPSCFSYDDVKACSRSELRFRSVPTGKRQFSVHIPLSLHGAADLFYCDCAFNAWRLPVPPDLKVYDSSSRETCATLRVDRVSFALSENLSSIFFNRTRGVSPINFSIEFFTIFTYL